MCVELLQLSQFDKYCSAINKFEFTADEIKRTSKFNTYQQNDGIPAFASIMAQATDVMWVFSKLLKKFSVDVRASVLEPMKRHTQQYEDSRHDMSVRFTNVSERRSAKETQLSNSKKRCLKRHEEFKMSVQVNPNNPNNSINIKN